VYQKLLFSLFTQESMTQLVANEFFKYYKVRLPNTYLISGNIYMSQAASRILIRNIADEYLIRNAIAENQFSTGAMNRLYEILEEAFSAHKKTRNQSLVTLRKLLNKWLLTIDLKKAIIT